MKKKIIKIILFFKKPIDLILSFLIFPAAILLLIYRRFGSIRLPLTTKILKRLGIFPIRNHYYEPLFDDRLIKEPLSKDRNLPGINLNVSGQLNFLKDFFCSQELIDLKLDNIANKNNFYINNATFKSGDAEYYYQIIRAIKPNKIIEIGSGNSTKVALLALQKNKKETGTTSKLICIEPYEKLWLDNLNIEVYRKPLQNLEFDWNKELNSGDILFIDSSHIIRPQGDVLKEYLEILPKLKQGVIIHIHDIFTPKDYLSKWIVEKVLFWNEQYLLEAMLSNTNRYEIIGALNFLKHNYYDELKKVCPYLTEDKEPGSFYIKII